MKEFTKRLKESKLILPPLAEYTDYPYRQILAEFKPDFICTEMISTYGIERSNSKTIDMLRLVRNTHLNGAQFLGNKPESMDAAARIVEEMGYDYIDINMGCTVRPIVNSGSGISLMANEKKAINVASAVLKAVDIPVTCKMRLGINSHCKNAKDLSIRLEDVGVSAITVHGRTGEKKLGLCVEYDDIKKVVNAVNIPVVANGGIFTGDDAVTTLEKTGASGIMPGRSLIGNPWLIYEINASLRGKEFKPPSLCEKKKIFLKHLDCLIDFYGESQGVKSSRRILGKYFAGSKNVTKLKLRSQKIESKAKIESLLKNLNENQGNVVYLG